MARRLLATGHTVALLSSTAYLPNGVNYDHRAAGAGLEAAVSTGIRPEVEAVLRKMRPDLELCPRCRCCEIVTDPCDACGGDGHIVEHDDPETFEDEVYQCDVCAGKGYFKFCCGGCDKNGKHDDAATAARKKKAGKKA